MDDLLALALLIGFILVSVLVIAAGGTRLHRWWWVGSLASGLIVAAIVGPSFVPILRPIPIELDSSLVGLGLGGLVGFLAASDVQVIIGILLPRGRGGVAPVVVGTLLGPLLAGLLIVYLG